MNRSAATVGAQYGPAPSSGSGSGSPAAISPAAAASSRISPSRGSSMPVSLVSRLTSRTPSPPLRSSGTGAAPRVSRTTSTSRSRSMTAPAATASTSAAVVVDTAGSGGVNCDRPGHLAAQHLTDQPRQDHGFGVDLPEQARGQQPLHRTVGRGAGRSVAGAAHRRALHQAPQQLALGVVEGGEPLGDLSAVCSAPFEDGLAGIPGQARRGLGGHPHLGVAPHQRRARAGRRRRRSTASSPARSPIRAVSLVSGTGVGLGMQHQQRVEHRQPQKVQVVGGGLDRLPGLRAGRQRRDAARGRLGQVGPQLQQPDQPLVRQIGQPGAQRGARIVFGHC